MFGDSLNSFEMLEELISECNYENSSESDVISLRVHQIEMSPNSKHEGGHIVRVFLCIGGKELYEFYEKAWNFDEIKNNIAIKIISYLFNSFKVCYGGISI